MCGFGSRKAVYISIDNTYSGGRRASRSSAWTGNSRVSTVQMPSPKSVKNTGAVTRDNQMKLHIPSLSC